MLFLFTWISGPYFISLISGGAGDWIAKVSDVGVPCLHDLTPNKNPRQQGLHSFPGGNTSYVLSHIIDGRIKTYPYNYIGRAQLEVYI